MHKITIVNSLILNIYSTSLSYHMQSKPIQVRLILCGLLSFCSTILFKIDSQFKWTGSIMVRKAGWLGLHPWKRRLSYGLLYHNKSRSRKLWAVGLSSPTPVALYLHPSTLQSSTIGCGPMVQMDEPVRVLTFKLQQRRTFLISLPILQKVA